MSLSLGLKLKLTERLILILNQVIDENKHNTESYSCENKRICQIWNDVGERNIIFIRFNPDSYTNSEGIKIKSCFKENRKIGALTLNPKEEQQWKERIDKLLETIEYWTNNVPDKLIEITFLFYDEIIEESDKEEVEENNEEEDNEEQENDDEDIEI